MILFEHLNAWIEGTTVNQMIFIVNPKTETDPWKSDTIAFGHSELVGNRPEDLYQIHWLQCDAPPNSSGWKKSIILTCIPPFNNHFLQCSLFLLLMSRLNVSDFPADLSGYCSLGHICARACVELCSGFMNKLISMIT